MGDARPEGASALGPDADEKRAVEPAAVLVVPLDVDVGGPGVVGLPLEDVVRGARLEPDVEDVEFLVEVPAAAGRAGGFGRDERRGVADEPGVGALGGEDRGDMAADTGVGQRPPAGPALEGRDGHTPRPLAGNAPVGPSGEHAVDPLPAPLGDPVDPADGLAGLAAQIVLVERDEPLFGGPEDDRLLAAPAMRVGVGDLRFPEQAAVGSHVGRDARVGLENLEPGVTRDLGGEPAVVVDGRVDVDAVGDAGQVVVVAVSRCRVDGARAVLEGDIFAEDQERVAVDERVPRLEAFELAAAERGQDLGLRPAQLLGDDRQEPLGQDVDVAVDRGGGVLVIGVEGDGHVARERPGRGRPDEDVGPAAAKGRELGPQVGDDREADVDRGRGLVAVFDLGLGQGGPAADAPVDRAFSLVDLAVLEESGQVFQDLGLVGRLHGQVGPGPRAEHTQALELLALDGDELLGVFAALLADGRHGQGCLLLAKLSVDVDLDGQAVAVPTGDVRGVMAEHGSGLDDEVLEDLVEGRAHVDVPVGVGRPVVEDEHRAAGAFPEDLFIETFGLPFADDLGLLLGQRGFHGESGLGQVQRALDIGLIGHRGLPTVA